MFDMRQDLFDMIVVSVDVAHDEKSRLACATGECERGDDQYECQTRVMRGVRDRRLCFLRFLLAKVYKSR